MLFFDLSWFFVGRGFVLTWDPPPCHFAACIINPNTLLCAMWILAKGTTFCPLQSILFELVIMWQSKLCVNNSKQLTVPSIWHRVRGGTEIVLLAHVDYQRNSIAWKLHHWFAIGFITLHRIIPVENIQYFCMLVDRIPSGYKMSSKICGRLLDITLIIRICVPIIYGRLKIMNEP